MDSSRAVMTSDLGELNRWWGARGQGPVRPGLLPGFGLVVPGHAAGFLYLTDAPGLVILDGYVTNPNAPILARANALKEITARLLLTAKERGAIYVTALCKSHGIERLATQNGLQRLGTYMLAGKEL